MRFTLPNAVAAINNAVAEVGEDGDSWEIVGDPLTDAVDEVLPEYNDKLDLKLDPSPGAKRAEICTVRWGKIDKDIARLNGLADAVENVSLVITSGKETIAHDWKGESYDAFRVQIEKVEKTLNDYVTAVRTTTAGLKAAIDGTRAMFGTYRDSALNDLTFLPRFSPPGEWRRMNHDDASRLADQCTTVHAQALGDCRYDNDPWRGIIDQKLVTKRLFEQLESWDCTTDGDVVTSQYNWVVTAAYDERKAIRDKIHNWYVATDGLKTRVDDALKAALENLRIIAELHVFATLSVPGAAALGGAPGGDPGPGTGGGDPGPGAGYPGPGATGYPGTGGGEVAMPSPEQPPPMAVDPTTAAEPEAAEPEATEPETVAPEPTDPSANAETVSISDSDRTISITSSDGQGHVKLTVDDGSGTSKTYSLDFNAASGLGPQPGAEEKQPEEGVEDVPARSDGKCVIQDGDVTITAERPLFSPDSLAITVDDGTGSPTSYTLDFPEEGAAADGDQTPGPGSTTQAGPAPSTGADPGTPAEAADKSDAAAAAGGNGTAARSGAADSGTAHAATEAPEQETAELDSPDDADAAAAPGSVAKPAAGSDAAVETPGPEAVATDQDAAASEAPEPAAQPAAAATQTSAQSWIGDQSGSLSGVLESNDSVGEAGLASVPDSPAPEPDDSLGMAGAGLPMGGGTNGAAGEPGRAGSGWSVHGDLFDTGEPVYSMHGVLGDDDLDSREAQ
jgi:uncharacterized protein YukE